MSEIDPVLIFIPHQDDEVFIFPYLIMLRKSNRVVKIIYLTNGEYKNFKSEKRNIESIKSLNSIGINKELILFLGENLNIRDGNLIFKLESIYNEIVEIFLKSKIGEIVVPAWEGGHHDHDATNFLISFIAKKFNLNDKVRQFYTYNCNGVIKPFFNVLTPIKTESKNISFKFSLTDGIKSLLCLRFYKSQFVTFIGLSPQLFYSFIFKRKIYFDTGLKNHCQKPHNGKLLYERRNRFSFDKFIIEINNFSLGK